MPFSITYSKLKKFTNGGVIFPSDLNNAFDDLGNQLAANNVFGGINEGSNVRRGKFIQATAGTRSNTAYGALSNGPDQVASVILPADGFIVVYYQAVWQSSVASAGKAALFLGANQVQLADTSSSSPILQEATSSSTIARDLPLVATQVGIRSSVDLGTAYTGDVTTGQIIGGSGTDVPNGPLYIFAAAGTYTVSIQFKATSGSVTVKNRILRVRTESYG